MPFSRTSTVPSVNSTVTVRFAGLMLLKAGADNTCEVGVHRLSASHTFQAMLVVNKPNRPLTFIRLTTGPLTAPLSLDVLPSPGAGFLAFAQEPFNHNDPNSHEFDYRWALNMRSWHPTADFNDGARPVVKLNSGILYTANLTRPGLNPQLAPAKPSDSAPAPKPLHRFAADLAVAIDIPPNGGLAVTWQESGSAQILTLPRKTDPPGTTYTISLMNDPPTSNTLPQDQLAQDELRHDELALYYKVLHDGRNPIDEKQQYRLHVPDQGRTDEIPCMPVTLDP